MTSTDLGPILNVLREAADFTRRVGATNEAGELESLCARLQTEKPTSKLLHGLVADAMNQAAVKIRQALLDDRRDPHPGKESLVQEHERIWAAFLKSLYPPEWSEMGISQFAGSEHVKEKLVSYKGDSNGVRPVVERSIALLRRYAQLIGGGEFEAAYKLTDSGLRAWMSLKKFVSAHERAAQEYGGPALDYQINLFAFVYADEAARKKSGPREGWPKLTAKENRRGKVLGFWVRDRAAKTGCGGTLWIAEENGEYLIAQFDFWRP
jgi:hypothetical protein